MKSSACLQMLYNRSTVSLLAKVSKATVCRVFPRHGEVSAAFGDFTRHAEILRGMLRFYASCGNFTHQVEILRIMLRFYAAYGDFTHHAEIYVVVRSLLCPNVPSVRHRTIRVSRID